MSKIIEPAAELSEFDREYLIARGKNPEDYIIAEDEVETDEVNTEAEDIPPYSEWKVDALKKEIDERNAERADEDKIEVDAPGNKPELIAALEADDESTEGDDDEDDA